MKKQSQSLPVYIAIMIFAVFLLIIAFWLIKDKIIMKTFKDINVGFSIQYPSNWVAEKNKNGAVVILYSPLENDMDTFQENVNVVFQNISSTPMDLQEYSKVAIDQLRAVFKQNMEIIDANSTFLNGSTAYSLEFYAFLQDSELVYKSVWLVDGVKVYQITFTGLKENYEKYKLDVARIISSFKRL